MPNYLIWSNEHKAWWCPDRLGYTPHLINSGRYTREEAIVICRKAMYGWTAGEPFPELPIKEDDLREFLRR